MGKIFFTTSRDARRDTKMSMDILLSNPPQFFSFTIQFCSPSLINASTKAFNLFFHHLGTSLSHFSFVIPKNLRICSVPYMHFLGIDLANSNPHHIRIYQIKSSYLLNKNHIRNRNVTHMFHGNSMRTCAYLKPLQHSKLWSVSIGSKIMVKNEL